MLPQILFSSYLDGGLQLFTDEFPISRSVRLHSTSGLRFIICCVTRKRLPVLTDKVPDTGGNKKFSYLCTLFCGAVFGNSPGWSCSAAVTALLSFRGTVML